MGKKKKLQVKRVKQKSAWKNKPCLLGESYAASLKAIHFSRLKIRRFSKATLWLLKKKQTFQTGKHTDTETKCARLHRLRKECRGTSNNTKAVLLNNRFTQQKPCRLTDIDIFQKEQESKKPGCQSVETILPPILRWTKVV